MARHREFDKDEALNKAMRLFWQKGYEATSIQDLVVAMGINRSSLYETFTGKHALFLAAVDRYAQVRGAEILAHLHEGNSCKAGIRCLYENVVAEGLQHPQGCLLVNATVECALSDPEILRRSVQIREALEAALMQIIARAQAEGEIGRRHEPRALARFVLSSMDGLLVLVKRRVEERILRDVMEVTLSALD